MAYKFDWRKASTQEERSIQTLDLTTRGGEVFKRCHVVGGPEGVMATCRTSRPNQTDLIWILSGDNGSWWVDGCFDETWLAAHIAVLKRV